MGFFHWLRQPAPLSFRRRGRRAAVHCCCCCCYCYCYRVDRFNSSPSLLPYVYLIPWAVFERSIYDIRYFTPWRVCRYLPIPAVCISTHILSTAGKGIDGSKIVVRSSVSITDGPPLWALLLSGQYCKTISHSPRR